MAAVGPLLRRSGDALGVPHRAGLSIRLTDDAELEALNRSFLGIEAATDVLAFPAAEGSPPHVRDRVGDVAVSVQRALAQASDGPAELRLLAVHGLLHCLGHDHAEPTGASRMTELTRRLLPDQTVPDLL